MFWFSLGGMLSTQTAYGQVSSPLAVMEGDVPGTQVSDEAHKKKDDTIYTVKGSGTSTKIHTFKRQGGKNYILMFLIKGCSTDFTELKGKCHVFSLK